MPMDLGVYRRRDVKALAVDFEGERVEFAYRPKAINPALRLQLLEAQEAQEHGVKTDMGIEIASVLSQLVDSWDITDDGAAVPTTAKGLRMAPDGLLGAMFTAIAEDIAPPKVTASDSGTSSSLS